jgi:hypothetical protein
MDQSQLQKLALSLMSISVDVNQTINVGLPGVVPSCKECASCHYSAARMAGQDLPLGERYILPDGRVYGKDCGEATTSSNFPTKAPFSFKTEEVDADGPCSCELCKGSCTQCTHISSQTLRGAYDIIKDLLEEAPNIKRGQLLAVLEVLVRTNKDLLKIVFDEVDETTDDLVKQKKISFPTTVAQRLHVCKIAIAAVAVCSAEWCDRELHPSPHALDSAIRAKASSMAMPSALFHAQTVLQSALIQNGHLTLMPIGADAGSHLVSQDPNRVRFWLALLAWVY